MYIINNRNEIDAFIRNVFNYYNGRIEEIQSSALLWLTGTQSK